MPSIIRTALAGAALLTTLVQPSSAEFVFRVDGAAPVPGAGENPSPPSVSYQPGPGPATQSGTVAVSGPKAPFDLEWDRATVDRVNGSRPILSLDGTGRTLTITASESCHGTMSLTRSATDGSAWRYQATPGQGSTCSFDGPFPHRASNADGDEVFAPGPTEWLMEEPALPVTIANLRSVASPESTRDEMHAFCFETVGGAGNFIHFARAEVDVTVSYVDADPDDGLDPTAEMGGTFGRNLAHFPRDLWIVPLSALPTDASGYQAMKESGSLASTLSFPSTSRPYGSPEPSSYATTSEREMCVVMETYDLEGLVEDPTLVQPPAEGAVLESVDVDNVRIRVSTMSFASDRAVTPIHDTLTDDDSALTSVVATGIRAFPEE